MILIYFLTLLIASFAVVSLLKIYLIKKPFTEIIDSLIKVEKGDLKTRILTKRKDQIGILAEKINTILSELEKSRKEIDNYQTDKIRHIEKMASIGEVAAAVAHEIKNPLAGISGALQVLAEDFPDDSPRKEIANDVLAEIERLDKAVKDLFIFAKPPELNLIPTDINAIIEKVKASIQMAARKLNVKINSISDNIPVIIIDPDQIEKVLLNIANNMIHSMSNGGILTIAAHNRYDTDEIEIALSDTGMGMDEEDLKEFFKPKFSIKHSGTGLGLAISRNIVESHKGRIEVEGKTGTGSTFRIILPKKR